MAEPDFGKLRKPLHAAVDKYVKQQARNTIAFNAERDPACEGYVRIPGPDACDFCVTMGAHDHFYRTRETAGGGAGHGSKDDRYHAYCNCQICLVFRRRGELVAIDPETGGAVPYDGAETVRRYQEAGRPTFAKNRAREAARRRAERADGKGLAIKGRPKGANTGKALPKGELDAAMKALADAASVEELESVADAIVKAWPKNAHGRNRAQWDELSRFAKNRLEELKLNPSMSVEVDRLVPCLVRLSDEEIVQTTVKRVKAKELREFNKANGWYIDWVKVPDDAEIYQLFVEGSETVEGMIAIRDDPANSAVRGLWAVAAPHNQAKRVGKAKKRYDGVGGHLFAIAAKRSCELGYNGFIHGKADTKKVLLHYMKEFGAEPTGFEHGLGFSVNEAEAHRLLGKYSWTDIP